MGQRVLISCFKALFLKNVSRILSIKSTGPPDCLLPGLPLQKGKKNPIIMKLWDLEEELAIEKSAEVETASDSITWTRGLVTFYFISVYLHHSYLQTPLSDNKLFWNVTTQSVQYILWLKWSVHTEWLFNLLISCLINHSTENKTNKMVCKYFHLPD